MNAAEDFFIAGTIPFALLGVGHLALTLCDLRRPTFFRPTEDTHPGARGDRRHGDGVGAGDVPVGHVAGTDFLQQDAIRSAVRETYRSVGPTDRRVAERFYSADELAGLPDETVRMALGVGNPVRHAGLRPGDDVLDLGSGGGIDCLIAGRLVNPGGSAVGVDSWSAGSAKRRRSRPDRSVRARSPAWVCRSRRQRRTTGTNGDAGRRRHRDTGRTRCPPDRYWRPSRSRSHRAGR